MTSTIEVHKLLSMKRVDTNEAGILFSFLHELAPSKIVLKKGIKARNKFSLTITGTYTKLYYLIFLPLVTYVYLLTLVWNEYKT